MKKLYFLKSILLLCGLIVGSSAWANDVVATINFGSAGGSTKIQGASGDSSPFTDTGNDSQGNTWTITTVSGTGKSFTQNAAYSQVGASKKPATSITFTTTLPASQTIKAFSAKFGGFSSTAGNVTLKVGSTSVGTGALNGTSDVIVSATNTETSGTVLTVTLTDIDKGVKCYYVSYTYDDGKSLTPPTISFPKASYTAILGEAFTEPTPTCNSDGVKTYSSNNTDVAEVNSSTGALTIKKAGNARITLSVAESATYEAGSAYYDLIVKGAIEDGVFDFAINQDYGSGAEASTTISTTSTTWTAGNVTMNVAGRNVWYNGVSLRVYKTSGDDAAGNITLSVPSGYVMTKIVLTGGTNLELTSGGGTKSGTTWSGKSQSVKFTHAGDGTITLTKITVTYMTPTQSETVQSYGWASYITPAAVEFNAGDAFVVTAASVAGGLTLKGITEAPAGTPVLLKNTGDKTITVVESASAPETNLLSVSTGYVAAGKYAYVLAKNGAGACFKQWTGTASTLKGRVVLILDEAVAPARGIFELENDATAIETIKTQSVENGEFFDLQGRKIAQPTKGLYIVNGKKVIIK